MDLKAHTDSASLAVNVQTGDVYKNVPIDCFVVTREPSRLDELQLFEPSALLHSDFYDPEKRKNSILHVQKPVQNENHHTIAGGSPVEDDGLTLGEVFHALENSCSSDALPPIEGFSDNVRDLMKKLQRALPNNTDPSDVAKTRKQIETMRPSHGQE